MQEKIFKLLFEEDDVTWQTILYDLVKTEQMDPWDVDVSLIAHKYIELVKNLKQMDFRLSGKVVLAAAILLKMKCIKLVGEDMLEFDRLIYDSDRIDEEEFYDELESNMNRAREAFDTPGLIPRSPQPRKRKVSIYDLINALEQALEVKRRRVLRSIPAHEFQAPEKKVDMSIMIKQVHAKVKAYFGAGQKVVTFSQLTPDSSRKEKLYTFIPLLHLSNDRKIDLWQKRHFGEIEILLAHGFSAETKREIENTI